MKVCPACGTEYGDEAAFCARDRSPLSTPGGGLVGQVLGERYQIEAKLGQGAMGEVYRARHVLMGRTCAIKVMSQALSKDADAIGRFNREATNASRINHPNVCAVYDFGFTPDGLLYLAMEYVEGRTLSEVLAEGPLEPARAEGILRQCASGLMAAHELAIVHRDLKPDNIMVAAQRGRETVKVVDFGIAKAAGAGDQRVTKTGLVVGTPEYMSPEQLSGDPIDSRSDQYTLALILYRMLTGVLPFSATSAQEAMTKRLTERPRPLTEVMPGSRFPAALEAALDKALARRPADRFPSVLAFADAVAAAIAPMEPGPALPRTRIVPEPARRRSAGLVAAAGLALVGLGWVAWRATRTGPVVPADAAVPAPPPAAPAVVPPSTRAAADLPPPAPAPSASRLTTADPPAATAPLEIPRLEDFDRPRSPEARQALVRALRLAEDPSRPDSLRAEMAWLVGQHFLDLGRRLDALRAFRQSCSLRERTGCPSMLRQLEDAR